MWHIHGWPFHILWKGCKRTPCPGRAPLATNAHVCDSWGLPTQTSHQPTIIHQWYVHMFHAFRRRKFRSQTSDNMDRWKSRGGKSQRGEKKREDQRVEEVCRKKMQVREKVGKSRFAVFPMICGSGGSKSILAKAAGAEPAGQMRDEKLHAIVARSTFPNQNVQSTPGSDHFWKLGCRKSARHCGLKHISKSKCTKHTTCSDHFWKLRCRKSARCCGAKHMSKSECTKHHMFGPLLEVKMSKKCTLLWRTTRFQVNRVKNWRFRTTFGRSDVVLRGRRKGLCTLSKVGKTCGFVAGSTTTTTTFHYSTLHYTTLHYTTVHPTTLYHTTLRYTPLRYTPLHYTTLHYTTLHYTTLRYTTLHYTTLHYTTLHYTTLHYITLHYTTLHYTTLHYTTLHYTTLHYTTLHYTTLHYTTLHHTTLHSTPLHSSTLPTTLQLQLQLHYTTLHYTALHCTALHYTTLHYITLHYTTLRYATLHYTTLHYTTLHYTTLHYTTSHYTTLHSTPVRCPLHYSYNCSCTTPHYIQQL